MTAMLMRSRLVEHIFSFQPARGLSKYQWCLNFRWQTVPR